MVVSTLNFKVKIFQILPFGLVAHDFRVEGDALHALVRHVSGRQRPLGKVLHGLGLAQLGREQGRLAAGFQEGTCL